MTTIATRTQYLELFPSTQAALDHEQTCLSIGEFRPPCADLVLAGAEPTPDYWTWLASQIERSEWSVGDRVEGGDTAEDYDTGLGVDVEGDDVTVAWDSHVRTTAPASTLRPEGERPINR